MTGNMLNSTSLMGLGGIGILAPDILCSSYFG